MEAEEMGVGVMGVEMEAVAMARVEVAMAAARVGATAAAINLCVANSGGCKLGFLLLTHKRVEREVQELLREVSTSIREQHRALAAAGDRRDHHGLPADEHGGRDQGRH